MHECTVELDLDVLADNLRAVKSALTPGAGVLFVVKADAYGHGHAGVIPAAAEAGADGFAVVSLREALSVRALAPRAEVLMLGVADPADAAILAEHRITPVVVGRDHADDLSSAASAAGVELPVHWKIDTGMGRLGSQGEEVEAEAAALAGLRGLRLTGLMSHFAAVETHRPELAGTQASRFTRAAGVAESAAGRPLVKHLSSSRAFQFHPEWDFDAVRPGILLYGYGCREPGMRVRTRPWLQWKGRLMQVKTVPAGTPVGYYSSWSTRQRTDIGIVNLGYADGFLRSLSNRGYVIAGGRRRPVVGRVSMNWIAVDLGQDCGLRRGDEVVLLGRQAAQEIWADEMARWAGTIAYEILTSINPRHERRRAIAPDA